MPIPHGITRQHVLQALAELDAKVQHPFGEPTGYWLVHEGKRYPPKAAIGLAAKHATGAILKPEDFSGGKGAGQANSFLADLGFKIVPFTETAGEDWTEDEVDLIVADYFEMLHAELLGQDYSKADHRRRLQEHLRGRSKGSSEFKHQNISAVLADLGYPYIEGYKPRGNYQGLLRERVEAYLEAHPGFLQDAVVGPRMNPEAPGAAGSPDDVFVTVPQRSENPDVAPPAPRRARKVDFAKADAQNRHLGKMGERWVVEQERKRLTQAGRPELAAEVEWTTDVHGDGLGYDVRSFESDGADRFIEVKTTGLSEYTPFYVSSGELRCSEEMGERYHLYRVFDFGTQPRIYVLRGPLAEACTLRAMSYLAQPKLPGS